MKDVTTPINYTLVFEPDLDGATFHGSESIQVQCSKPTDTIVLDCAELDVTSCVVEHNGTSNDKHDTLPPDIIIGCTTETDPKKEELRILLDKKIRGHATIRLEFDGTLNDRLLGFYRSQYKHDGKTKYLATTQFEAADARRAFPCWDRPDAKATFEITIITDNHFTAISNMPTISRRNRGTKTVYKFAKTPIVSTYLIYLGVGEFEYLTARTSPGQTRIRVVTTPGNKSKGRFAMDLGRKLLGMYEQYFDIKYPLPKLDLIAVPDFAAGAMENWGAITFRETILLYDPKTSSTHTKQFIAEVISHEIAHQWFGNLVTMKWWNDLWLNESFATFMATKFVHQLYPEWDMWEQFVQDAMNTAMGLDSLKTTHPIDVKVESPAEIREIFDAISYDKGGCVLRMLEDYVGEPNFQKGLRQYLSKFKYDNATGQDLWDAIGKASAMPVKRVVNTWLRQPGFPLVSIRQKGSTIRLEQQRYLREPESVKQEQGAAKKTSPNTQPMLWPIPISIDLGGAQGTSSTRQAPSRKLFSTKTTSLRLPKATVGFVANHGRKGFYRVRYDDAILLDLKMLIDTKRIAPIDRWAVQNDLFSLCISTDTSVHNYLDFSDAYLEEENYLVSSDVAGNLYTLYLHSFGEGFAGEMAGHASKFFHTIMARLGWKQRRSHKHTDAMLRAQAVSCLGHLNDKQTTAEALDRYATFLDSHDSLPPDLVSPVCSIAAWNGGKKIRDELLSLYRDAPTMEEKLRFLGAMSHFQDKKLLIKSLDFSLTSEVRSQNLQLPIMRVASNPYAMTHMDILWPWLKKNWKTIFAKAGHGNPLLNRIVASIASVTDDSMQDDICDFFQRHPTPGTERTQAQTLERIRISSRFARMMHREFGVGVMTP